MDNLTHTLTGWLVGRCFPERWGRWVVPVSMVAANLPDAEALFVSRSDKPGYLIEHRGWSHSLLGIAGEVLVLGVIVAIVTRLRRPRDPGSTSPRLSWIFTVVAINAYVHLFLDWWNTYGVRPLYPFVETWHHGDLAVLMDPWIWLIMLGALLAGSRFRAAPRETSTAQPRAAGLVATMMILAVACCGFFLVMAVRFDIVPAASAVAWTIAALVLIAIRFTIRWPHPPRRTAVVGLGLTALYVSGLFTFSRTSHQRALDAFRGETGEDTTSVHASANPVPSLPWRYEVLVQTEDRLYQYGVNAITGDVSLTRTIEHNLDDPALAALSNTREFEAWTFSRHPVVRRSGDTLILGDARYQVYRSDSDWTALELPIPE